MKEKKQSNVLPTFLLTNDDGFSSQGIFELYLELSKIASVTVAAPDRERSGTGHAFSIKEPLHYELRTIENGLKVFVITGTPVDCVKFAVSYLLSDGPAAVVAGINRGENSGLSAFYSGTVAAAREGAFWGIPSIAFSACNSRGCHAKEYVAYAKHILLGILSFEKKRGKHNIFYNVNFPSCAPEECKGLRITRQSLAFFDDRYKKIGFKKHRTKKGYVVFGEKKDIEKSYEYDTFALMNNYITITPMTYDTTAFRDKQNHRRLYRLLKQRLRKHGHTRKD